MASINPAEVSAILKQELSGAADSTKARQEGTVLEIGDGIAQLYGLSEAVWEKSYALKTEPKPSH